VAGSLPFAGHAQPFGSPTTSLTALRPLSWAGAFGNHPRPDRGAGGLLPRAASKNHPHRDRGCRPPSHDVAYLTAGTVNYGSRRGPRSGGADPPSSGGASNGVVLGRARRAQLAAVDALDGERTPSSDRGVPTPLVGRGFEISPRSGVSAGGCTTPAGALARRAAPGARYSQGPAPRLRE
jgi:hypothetical protein